MAPDAAFEELIGLVIDGSPLDWDALDASTTDADERDLLRHLRLIAKVGAVHGAESATPEPSAARLEPNQGSDFHGRVVPFPAARSQRPPAVGPGVEAWGHFELCEQVGSGTFGDVYRARDTRLDREVAIKLLRPEVVEAHRQLDRLVQEGQALARVEHPNVVRVHSIEQHSGRIGLCMELLQGPTLEDMLQARGPFECDAAANAGREVCAALTAVHRANLLHRDVKARNVIRTSSGRVVLMDFGAGQFMSPAENLEATMAGTITGTPLYLAPEVLEGGAPSTQSDIYAVGVLLFRLVTGGYPVAADDLPGLLEKHRARAPVQTALAHLPAWFVAVVTKALHPTPDARWTSAEAMAEALVPPVPIEPMLVERGEQARSSRLARTLAIVFCAVMVTLLAVLTALLRTADPAAKTVKVAILPFENRTSQPAWFAAGLARELDLALSGLPGIRLSSAESVMAALDGDTPGPASIDRVLSATNADRALVAVVDERSAGFDIDIELRHAGNRAPLWRTRVRMAANGPFAFEDGVITDVMTALSGRAPRTAARAPQPSLPVEVLPRYWQATALLAQASRESLLDAREAFESLTAEYPEFDRGWAGLAQAITDLRLRGQLGPEAPALAEAAVRQALRVNEGLADAHVQAADISLYFDWDWTVAEQQYVRALELNPSHTRARTQYARFLAAAGRLDEALSHARANLELNPMQADAHSTVGITLYYGRRFDAAVGYMQTAVEAAPKAPQSRLALARVLAAQRRFDEALAQLEISVELSGELPGNLAELARTYAAAGQHDRARAILGRTDVSFEPEQLTYVFAALGDQARAIEHFEAAIARRATTLLWAGVDPRLDNLRDDGRFAELIGSLRPRH